MTTLLAALVLAGPPTSLTGWTLVAGGDIMLNGVSPANNPLALIAEFVRPADVAIANQEIPLTRSTVRTLRKSSAEIARRDQYVLKADPAHAKWIGTTGFDLVSLANNHGMDYGEAGAKETRAVLRRAGVFSTGTGKEYAAFAPAFYRAGQSRVALISALAFIGAGALGKCSPAAVDRYGVATLNFGGALDDRAKTFLKAWVARAHREADFVIVALHWGLEKQTVPTSYQVALGRAVIDAGADMVHGHHPHVLQGAELYRGKPILYSMGNLISPTPAVSALARLRFEGAAVRSVEWLPIRISGGVARPLPPSEAARERARIQNLSRQILQRYPSPSARPLPTA